MNWNVLRAGGQFLLRCPSMTISRSGVDGSRTAAVDAEIATGLEDLKANPDFRSGLKSSGQRSPTKRRVHSASAVVDDFSEAR